MPCGYVCQLHYAGGGLVHTSSSGASVSLPFRKAPFLQVGQRVDFSISRRFGYDEAVDLQVVQAQYSDQEIEHCPDVESGGVKLRQHNLQQQISRLRRSIGRFRNAKVGERVELVKRAEEKLAEVLAEDQLDGNEIAKFVRRCAGWLSVARACTLGGWEPGHGGTEGEQKSMQRRIRKLLIMALGSLDLADSDTYQAVKAAVTYIQALLEKNKAIFDDNAASSAARQWRALRSLVFMAEPSDEEGRKTSRSKVVDGKFAPPEKVRRLSTVFCEKACELECAECSYIITSKWYWKHPKNGRVHVLVPNNGHWKCRLKLGKKCAWNALDDTPTKLDDIYHLDFCPHLLQRSKCPQCGGREICEHGSRRYRCLTCKNQPSGPEPWKNIACHIGVPVCLFEFTQVKSLENHTYSNLIHLHYCYWNPQIDIDRNMCPRC